MEITSVNLAGQILSTSRRIFGGINIDKGSEVVPIFVFKKIIEKSNVIKNVNTGNNGHPKIKFLTFAIPSL